MRYRHISAIVISILFVLPSAMMETAQAGAVCPIRIDRLPPDARGGQAYRLVYEVPLSIQAFWRFKTNFDNTFLERNRYIVNHRFISLKDNLAITENRYTVSPEAVFRWQTRIFPQKLRLEFELINSSKEGRHGHRFHYGNIQLSPLGGSTRVIQEAYFDFWGAGLWAIYPWSGGMHDFLKYTANWECREAVRFQRRMADQKK